MVMASESSDQTTNSHSFAHAIDLGSGIKRIFHYAKQSRVDLCSNKTTKFIILINS